MGFTKLDEKILQSSVMSEPATTFKVWIAFLASCREDGVAPVSSVYLARVCHLPLAIVDKAISVLEKPDDRSRSTNEDGRRIERIDGGFRIINYFKYRDYTYSSNPDAIRKREYRDRHRDNPGHVPKCPDISASASASASSSGSEEKEKDLPEEKGSIVAEFEAGFWKAYPLKVQKQDALAAYKAIRKTVEEKTIASAFDGYMQFLKHQRVDKKFDQNPMYPATFLRKERWKDYVGFTYKPRL